MQIDPTGRAVVITGSACPVGYLVARSGVQVMPVVMLGAEGRVATDPPRPRSRIDVFFFPPVSLPVDGDPLAASTRARLNERVRQLVADSGREALMRTGGR